MCFWWTSCSPKAGGLPGDRITQRCVLSWRQMCLSSLVMLIVFLNVTEVEFLIALKIICCDLKKDLFHHCKSTQACIISCKKKFSVWGLEQAFPLPSSMGYQLHFNGTSMCICSPLLLYLIVWEPSHRTCWDTAWRYFHYCTSSQFDFPQQLPATGMYSANMQYF